MSRTLILGLGISGVSCVRYLAPRGDVVVSDTRPEPPFAATLAREFPDVELLCGAQAATSLPPGVTRVVASPGVSLDDPVVAQARAAGVSVVGDVELFLAAANAPVVGITGTNAKSTVTSLVAAALEAAGKRVAAGGNLGVAALDLLDDSVEVYVLELSSFQLERIARPELDVAAFINLSEDHVDRHPTEAAYVAAKQQVYAGAGAAVCDGADARTHPRDGLKPGATVRAVFTDPGWRAGDDTLTLGGVEFRADCFALKGAHNRRNIVMAAAIADLCGVAPERAVRGLKAFAGLPHRCQHVGTHSGVDFVDDSKATNVGAAVAALDGYASNRGARVVWIAGGDGKGADFAPLKEPVGQVVAHALLLGRDADAIDTVVREVTQTERVTDMSAAVSRAFALARKGDTVLLSPACASLDMYDSYVARGLDFQKAVAAVAEQS